MNKYVFFCNAYIINQSLVKYPQKNADMKKKNRIKIYNINFFFFFSLITYLHRKKTNQKLRT